jgi:hypothetical protein
LLVISFLRWTSPDTGEDLVASAGVAVVAVTGNAGVGIAPGVVARLVTEVAVLAAAGRVTILTDFFFIFGWLDGKIEGLNGKVSWLDAPIRSWSVSRATAGILLAPWLWRVTGRVCAVSRPIHSSYGGG